MRKRRVSYRNAHLSDVQLTAAIGTIGQRGAKDLMAFIRLADKLPTLQSIKDDPKNALVPDTAAAKVMVVSYTGKSEKDWFNAWMDYLDRLDRHRACLLTTLLHRRQAIDGDA